MLRLYEQIYMDICQKIENNTLKAGDILPSENELEEIYQVSRAPVRQALGLLAQENIIVRMPGRGTFVAFKDKPQTKERFKLSPFTQQIERDFDKINCRTFSACLEVPSKKIATFFKLQATERVIHIYRVRRVNKTPVVLSHHYLPNEEHLKTIQAIGNFFSIQEVLENVYGIEPTLIEDDLSAVVAEGDIAKKMELKKGHPLIKTCRRSYCNSQPILYDLFYTQTDVWNYSISFKK